MRRGIIPDFIPEGQEHLHPALRDKDGRPSDYFPDPEEEAKKGASGRVPAPYEANAELFGEKPKRGAKSDA